MKRLPIVGGAAVVAAGALAAIPAVLGLAGNPSFSQQVPVRPPQHARVLVLSSSHAPRAVPRAATPTVTSVTPTPTVHSVDSDDRSPASARRSVPADRVRELEPADDRGRNRDGEDEGHRRGGRHAAQDG
jgi:hypothetical protein